MLRLFFSLVLAVSFFGSFSSVVWDFSTTTLSISSCSSIDFEDFPGDAFSSWAFNLLLLKFDIKFWVVFTKLLKAFLKNVKINVDSFFSACKSIFDNAIRFLPIKSKTLIHENASAKERLASAKITTNIKAPKTPR